MTQMDLSRNSDLLLGVQVRDARDSAIRNFEVSDLDKYMVVITAESGPTEQITPIYSEQEFVGLFGHYVDGSYGRALAHVMYTMNKGMGKQPNLNIVRVVGASATKAAITLVDANGVNTLKVQDKYYRDGQHLKVQVLEGRTTLTVEDAGAAPTLVRIASGGTIVAGTYTCAYTWYNDHGETLLSDSADITMTGDTNKITYTSPNPLPYGAAGLKAYIKVAGNWRLAGTSAVGAITITISALPAGGDDQEPASNTATIPTFNLKSWIDGNEHEVYFGDLTLEPSVIAKFNEEHPDLELIDQDSASTPPEDLPAVMASALWLTGGATDNTNVDAAKIVGTITAGAKTGLKLFDDDALGPGFIAAPGWADATVRQELVANAEKYHRIAVCDLDSDIDPDEAKTWADTGEIDSPFCAVPFPWWGWSNPDYVIGYGDTRYWMPPSIQLLAAQFKAAHEYSSRFRPAAGNDFKLVNCPPVSETYAIGGLKYKITNTEATEMGDKYGICTFQERHFLGPVIYDCVVKNYQNDYKFIAESQVECAIYYDFLWGFDRSGLVFNLVNTYSLQADTNVSDFFLQASSLSEDIMKGLYSQGAFTAVYQGRIVNIPTKAFKVVCDNTNNTLQNLSQGVVRLDVSYHPLTIARKIEIVLHQRHLTQPL